jgi:DNA-binding HxlR family transcriptional regulator
LKIVIFLILWYILITMGKRSYRQFCMLAMALDIIGERWTLLLIRELLEGPKRYTDLIDGLPGIGTNLLSQRLKELESYDLIIHRRLPPPAASAVYELTEIGRSLEPVVSAIGHWGASVILKQKVSSDTKYFRAGWAALAMRYIYNEDLATTLNGSFEIRVDDEIMHVVIKDGVIDPRFGPAKSPVFTVSMNLDTYKSLLLMETPVEQLVKKGRIKIEGSVEDAFKFYELFMPAIESQFDMKE